MKTKFRIFIAAIILCAGCTRISPEKTITVALYPYLNEIDKAEKIVREIWEKDNPEWKLVFTDWNCYNDEASSDVDVFYVDCLYEQFYVSRGMTYKIPVAEIKDCDDFYKIFSLTTECNGIPCFLCSDFLIYPSKDKEMAKCVNTRELLDYAGEGNIWTLIRGNRTGYYLRSFADLYGYDGRFRTMTIDPLVLENLKPFKQLGGEQSKYSHSSETAEKFVGGSGKAYVSFSECLYSLTSYPEPLSVTNFSMSGTARSNYFYADIVCVNSAVTDKEKRKASLKLANILAGREFLDKFISNDGKCLFYIPARPSVSRQLKREQNVYHYIDSLASAPDAVIFYGDSNYREYDAAISASMKDFLK